MPFYRQKESVTLTNFNILLQNIYYEMTPEVLYINKLLLRMHFDFEFKG